MDRVYYLENSIQKLFDAIFGEGTTLNKPAILREFRHLKAWCVARLLITLNADTRENIKDAVLTLYQPLPHPLNPFSTFYPPDVTWPFFPGNIFDWIDKQPQFSPLTWKEINSLLSLWAVLVSEESTVIFKAYSTGDRSDIERYILEVEAAHNYEKDQNLSEAAFSFTQDTLSMILQELERIQGISSPVRVLGSKDIELIHQGKKNFISPQDDPIAYRLANKCLHVAIDPYNNIDNILAEVRGIVEAEQERMLKDHNNNWSDEEREFHDQAFIDSNSPLNDFYFKPAGHTGEAPISFISEAIEALLIFELRRFMKPGEINKSFFPRWPEDTAPYSRPRVKLNNRRFKKAKEIIDKALCGWNLQPHFVTTSQF